MKKQIIPILFLTCVVLFATDIVLKADNTNLNCYETTIKSVTLTPNNTIEVVEIQRCYDNSKTVFTTKYIARKYIYGICDSKIVLEKTITGSYYPMHNERIEIPEKYEWGQ